MLAWPVHVFVTDRCGATNHEACTSVAVPRDVTAPQVDRKTHLELTLEVATTVELVNWIHSFGPDARVVSPPGLGDRIQADLKRTLKRYASP